MYSHYLPYKTPIGNKRNTIPVREYKNKIKKEVQVVQNLHYKISHLQ